MKRARPRRALAVLEARFSSCFELLQSAPDPPAPANPITYPLRGRVHAVIPHGSILSPPLLETSQAHMAKLRSCVFSRNGQTVLPCCSSSTTNLSMECAWPCRLSRRGYPQLPTAGLQLLLQTPAHGHPVVGLWSPLPTAILSPKDFGLHCPRLYSRRRTFSCCFSGCCSFAKDRS